jgi:hypothetical protein
MSVTIDNISRLLERTQIRQTKGGSPTFLNIKNGFDSFKITKGTEYVNFKENYEFCIFSKLIILEKENLVITKLGKSYLEITDLDLKKKFLRDLFVGDNKISQIIFSILNNFDYKNKKCSCPVDLVYHYFKNYKNWIKLLYEINFLKRNRSTDTVEINSEISNHYSFERSIIKSKLIQNKQRKPVPLAEQEKNRKKEEERNKITGEIAEDFVVKYEKKRLEMGGFHNESKKVKKISEENSTAGYDVESFFGKADDLTVPDKLIEVKGTSTNIFRFFWSKNEIKTAQELGQNYWIYFVSDIDKLKKTGNIIRKIQDPFDKIFPLNYFDGDDGEYNIKCDSYIISDTVE